MSFANNVGKGKLLIMSNFSFSKSFVDSFRELSAIFLKFEIVICKFFEFGTEYNLSFGKGLTYTTQYRILMHSRYIAVENIVRKGEKRKGEIACNKQFLIISQCVLHGMVLIFHFKCTLECHLQFVSIWTSLKLCCLVKS